MPTDATAADRRGTWFFGGALALLAGFYAWRGMPWSNPDEFCWIGAAMDVVRTGQLTNHAMDGWLAQFGTDRFFVQPPFAVYTLAGWIALCGATSKGFVIFEWIWYALGSWAFARTLARFGVAPGMRLLLVAIYLSAVVTQGSRPEPEMFAWMFLGLAFLETRAGFGQKTGALVALGCAVITYPVALAIAAPFAAVLIWMPAAGPDKSGKAIVRTWAGPMAAAVALVVIVFLLMIHFEWRSFFAVITAHRESRIMPGNKWMAYLRTLLVYQQAFLTLPVNLLLAATAGYVAIRWRTVEPRVRRWVGASVIAAVACIDMYADKAPEFVLLLAFGAACVVASQPSWRRWRWPVAAALGALFLWTQALWFVIAALQQFPDPARLQQVRAQALHSGKELVVDSSTARYVFNYELPPGTLLADYLGPWDGRGGPAVEAKRAQDFWVITAITMEMHSYDMPPEMIAQPHVTIMHHVFHSAPLCPNEPLVLP